MKELSKKNPYYLSRYRRKELEYWCLQYDEWADYYMNTISLQSSWNAGKQPTAPSMESQAERATVYISNMDLIGRLAKETDPSLSLYIITGVTKGMRYDDVNPPCCRNIWYKLLRKFFWLLDKARN